MTEDRKSGGRRVGGGCCEESNEISGYIKRGKIFCSLQDLLALKKDCCMKVVSLVVGRSVSQSVGQLVSLSRSVSQSVILSVGRSVSEHEVLGTTRTESTRYPTNTHACTLFSSFYFPCKVNT